MNVAKNQRYELVVLGCETVILYCICIAEGNSITTAANPCNISGNCGAFGVCNSQASPAVCSCLEGFDPLNDQEWSRGNWSGGCRRRLHLNCTQLNNTTDDVFVQLQMMEMSGYTDFHTGLQQNECQGRCMSNCSCLAYGFVLSFGCMLWTGTLMDLRKSSTGLGSYIYVRLSYSEPEKKDSSMKKKIVIILLLVAFIVITSACTYLSWKWRAKKKKIKLKKAGPVDEVISQVSVEELPMLKFEIVANATANFSEANKLGKGGFGPVYKRFCRKEGQNDQFGIKVVEKL